MLISGRVRRTDRVLRAGIDARRALPIGVSSLALCCWRWSYRSSSLHISCRVRPRLYYCRRGWCRAWYHPSQAADLLLPLW